MFLYLFFVISVRPVISTSTGPIFTKFAAEMIELWLQMNGLKLIFRPSAQFYSSRHISETA